MSLISKIRQIKGPQVSRQESLVARPIQNSDVRSEHRGKSLLLRLPLKKNPKTSKLATAFLNLPADAHRKIVLDSIGAGIWELCNQRNAVADIIELTRRRYKFSHKEALISVTTFLKQRGGKGLIAFVVPKATGGSDSEE